MYDFFIDGELLPVTPGKLDIKCKGKNKTITLINDGEVNVIKSVGLQEISFEALLPNQKYPFSRFPNGFKRAGYYIDFMRELMELGRPFQFIVVRRKPSGAQLSGINIRVTIDSMTIHDDADNGTDQNVALTLKQYRDYGTKVLVLSANQETATVSQERQTDNAPQAAGGSYTVQKGDSLWKIAKHFYGNGSDYKKIYDANTASIKNPNLIYPGQTLIIP